MLKREIVPPIGYGKNPEYSSEDFKATYPFFFTAPANEMEQSVPLIPVEVVDMYVEFAHACVKEWRYHRAWKMCMGLFIAHFCILYMRTMADPGSSAAEVLRAGQARGLQSSKSVGGVSVSYDFTQATQGLDNWAAWTSTEYGIQLATLAKMYGPRSIYIP